MRKLFSLCIGRALGVKLNTCTSFSVAFYYFYMHIHDIYAHICRSMILNYNYHMCARTCLLTTTLSC